MTEEEKLDFFELKQKVLGEIPHPKLIVKYANQAGNKVGIPPFLIRKEIFEIQSIALVDFLENQLNKTLILKQKIANSVHFNQLNELLIELYKLQMLFFQQLKSYLPTDVKFEDETIKMSLPIDPYQLLKRIRERNLNENEIKPYLYTQTVTKVATTDELTAAFLRANKIIEHA